MNRRAFLTLAAASSAMTLVRGAARLPIRKALGISMLPKGMPLADAFIAVHQAHQPRGRDKSVPLNCGDDIQATLGDWFVGKRLGMAFNLGYTSTWLTHGR